METIDRLLLITHITAGTLSLISFFIPIFAKKGGGAHRRAGKFYVLCMWVVVATAALLSIINLMEGAYILAAFLGYLTILTSYPLWYAVTILDYKKHLPKHVLYLRKGLNLILFFGGIGLVTWSLIMRLEGQTILLLIFGILGLTSFSAAFETPQKTQSDHHWLQEHISGMIITGIAAYTAFLAFGGSTLFSELLSGNLIFIPWVLPTIAGTLIIRYYTRSFVRSATDGR